MSSENITKKVMIAAGLIGGIGLIYYLTSSQPEQLNDGPEKLSKMDRAL
tara:strand:+ start:45 stop:191 length:147 start_codon:yes stop_codon:yes gene_type:complete